MKSKIIIFQSIICFSLLFFVGYYKDKAGSLSNLQKETELTSNNKMVLNKSKVSGCVLRNELLKKKLKVKTSYYELQRSRLLNVKASKTIDEAKSQINSMNINFAIENKKTQNMIEKQNQTIVALEMEIHKFSPFTVLDQTCIPITTIRSPASPSDTAESLGDLYQD